MYCSSLAGTHCSHIIHRQVDLGDPPQDNCPLSPGPPPTVAPDVTPEPTAAPNVAPTPTTTTTVTKPPSCVGKGGGRHYDDKYGTDSTSSKGGKDGKAGGGKMGSGSGKNGKGGLMKKERSGKMGSGSKGGAKAMMMLHSDRRMLNAHNGNIFADECEDESRDYGGTDSRDGDTGKGGKGGKGDYRRRMALMNGGGSQQQHRAG